MKKTQLSLEFIFLIGIAVVSLMGYLIVLNQINVQKGDEKSILLMNQLGNYIQGEIVTAAKVNNGYERNFSIPPPQQSSIYDVLPYTVSNTNNLLIIRHSASDYVFRIPEISGTLVKGNNQITKNNNIITITN